VEIKNQQNIKNNYTNQASNSKIKPNKHQIKQSN